ncbi:WhiB family transcriptional regulator [Scrofimicrobium sp. R131]|uniref:Transcriptional regulator WhiB n=1 Tax=Scrofimicrobium appendicitidis TaxID=3079930 RepID=A0AAU7V8Y5_9ACTO
MTQATSLIDRRWVDRAVCAGGEPDALFVQGAAQRQVRQRCLACPVRIECLADALQTEANFGVWGGLTERERRAILRHYHDVEDWYSWLLHSDDGLAEELRQNRIPRVFARMRDCA